MSQKEEIELKNNWFIKYLPWFAVPFFALLYYSLLLIMSMTSEGETGFNWIVVFLITFRLSVLWYLAQKCINIRKAKGKELNVTTFLLGAVGIMLLNVAIYYILRSILIPIFAPEYPIFQITIFLLNFLEGFLEGIILMSILYSINHFKQWQKEVEKNEHLKANELELNNKVLRNQLNPHFLFNNLNTLSSLIKSDPETANLFLHEMSDIYRYILKTSDDEVVELSAEIKFAESYIHILSKRFGDNFKVSIEVDELDYYLPPMSLHSVLENIIKHNRIDTDYPMRFSIKQVEDYLIIKNQIHLKNNVDSTGKGIVMLKKQYKFLTNREVIIEESPEFFVVKIPLLKL
ncbi:MAG: two-component system LytT family sensor kinase [Flavobacteriales bacterium]|jgi:two-component system LytT family sensor kinase